MFLKTDYRLQKVDFFDYCYSSMSSADNKADYRERMVGRPVETHDPGQTTVYSAVSPHKTI